MKKIFLASMIVFIFAALTCVGYKYYHSNIQCGKFALEKWFDIKNTYAAKELLDVPSMGEQKVKIKFKKTDSGDFAIAYEVQVTMPERTKAKSWLFEDGRKYVDPNGLVVYGYLITEIEFEFIDADGYIIHSLKSDPEDIGNVKSDYVVYEGGEPMTVKKLTKHGVSAEILKKTNTIQAIVTYKSDRFKTPKEWEEYKKFITPKK